MGRRKPKDVENTKNEVVTEDIPIAETPEPNYPVILWQQRALWIRHRDGAYYLTYKDKYDTVYNKRQKDSVYSANNEEDSRRTTFPVLK